MWREDREGEIFVGERLTGQYIYRGDERLITMHEERAVRVMAVYDACAECKSVGRPTGQKVLISIANRRPRPATPSPLITKSAP